MESTRLEKYKKQYKYFNREIDLLQHYLNKVGTSKIINPYNVSKALAISEFDAIFLLSLAENENLLHKKFFVFTKNEHNPLGEFDSSTSIPQVIIDDETGNEVYKDDYYVDIAFEVA